MYRKKYNHLCIANEKVKKIRDIIEFDYRNIIESDYDNNTSTVMEDPKEKLKDKLTEGGKVNYLDDKDQLKNDLEDKDHEYRKNNTKSSYKNNKTDPNILMDCMH